MNVAVKLAANEVVTGVVVVHGDGDPPQPVDGHEAITRAAIARELAALKGYVFAGEYDAAFAYPGGVYHVPRDPIVGCDAARSLGIATEHDLFGGVVPHAFVATKTICHPLIGRDASAPAGWSHAFADSVGGSVLDGYAAFTAADALEAGSRVLERGPVRVKRALGIGGRGQEVVDNRAALADAIDAIDRDELRRYGVSLEQNLTDVVTYSVGQVRVGALVASYYGTQRLTTNHAGHEVYGGSDLVVVRGDFAVLLALDVDRRAREAVEHARRFHALAVAHYPGLLVSRLNYDIAAGSDGDGAYRCGVLEQSWRLGGASGAEVAALSAFDADASLLAVRASTVELYAADVDVPPDATVHFRGNDPRVGSLVKYATVTPYVDAG